MRNKRMHCRDCGHEMKLNEEKKRYNRNTGKHEWSIYRYMCDNRKCQGYHKRNSVTIYRPVGGFLDAIIVKLAEWFGSLKN